MRFVSNVLAVVMSAISACAAVAIAQAAEQPLTITHGQRQRTALIRVPASYDASRPAPLLLVFHGGGGNADGAVRMAQLEQLAEQHRIIVVYPNGTGPLPDRLLTWNAWNCCGYANEHRVDDVGFVRTLIGELQRQYAIDPNRVFAAGLSNGGMMVHRLGCELSDRIAAIAAVAGALNTDACAPREAVSVVIFHGTEDQHVLFEGGQNRKRFPGAQPRVDRSVAHALSTWSALDKCTPEPPSRRGSIVKTACSNGTRGTEVVLYAIEGQGHAWPGGRPGLRNANIDPPTHEISASQTMVEFFLQHPKR